jgi:phage terminase large subunit-like protein
LIEAANAGVALIQELKRGYGLHVSAVSARRSKKQRAVAVAPLLENGDVCFPEAAEWLPAFAREVRTFPHGAHDDMVDALVHGLAFLKRHIQREQPRVELLERERPVLGIRPRGGRRPPGARAATSGA